MKKIDKNRYICIAVLAIMVFGLFSFVLIQSNNHKLAEEEHYFFSKARVDKITYDDTDRLNNDKTVLQTKQEFEITILDGKHKGEKYKIRNTIEAIDMHRIIVNENDEIVINYTISDEGKINSIHLYEIVRENYLYLLIGIFIVSVVLICGKMGVKSVLTLAFTSFMIIKVLLPILVSGFNPLIATILVCVVTVASSLFFINGINRKTIISVLGTIGGIVIATVVAVFIGNMCKITGLAETESQMIAYTNSSLGLNFKHIMFSAIIIGSLGAIMDVSVSITSAMDEILQVKNNINKRNFIKSGMNVGKDIIGAMSNTLILAYAGGAFSLIFLLYAQQMPYINIINMEIITTEIITAFSGSLGIVWTVPITVFAMANLVFRNNTKSTNKRIK
ncbi:YibE/F family protein [Clostridium taeniosporum]|uniref:YibE/F family protein n=1 Tax=Clostridium taeniosporum TaxID=394958 RepID=A0A1D7XFZ9_9CLOT|nr:YibE/F family protein [Clostridium taeniosporum]AOR22277.1 YibE/F family protein [Clostridium taeniosporum]